MLISNALVTEGGCEFSAERTEYCRNVFLYLVRLGGWKIALWELFPPKLASWSDRMVGELE